jgi:hypothetical protein
VRKLLLLLALLFLWTTPSFATIAYTTRHCTNSSSGTTVACTITSQVSGNLNAIYIGWTDNASPNSDTVAITDGAGNSYSCPAGAQNNTGSPSFNTTAICYANSIATSASNLITATITTANTVAYNWIGGAEISGQATSSVLDQTGTLACAVCGSPASVSTSGSTTQANELVFAGGLSSTMTNTASAPFMEIDNGNYGMDMYNVVSSTGTQTASMTFPGGPFAVEMSIATFEAASAGGGVAGIGGSAGIGGKAGIG